MCQWSTPYQPSTQAVPLPWETLLADRKCCGHFFFFFFRRAAFNSQQQKYQCFGIPVSLNLSCVFNRNRISCHWSSLWQTLLKYFPNCKIHHLHFSAWNCGQVVSLWVHPQISNIIWAMILEFVRHVSMFSTWNVSCHLWTNHAVHLIRQML